MVPCAYNLLLLRLGCHYLCLQLIDQCLQRFLVRLGGEFQSGLCVLSSVSGAPYLLVEQGQITMADEIIGTGGLDEVILSYLTDELDD